MLSPQEEEHHTDEQRMRRQANLDAFGSGCLGALFGMWLFSGGAAGCLSALGCLFLIPLILLGLVYWLWPALVWLGIAFAPTIVITLEWLRYRNHPSYQSLDKRFSNALGMKPSNNPIVSILVAFILWGVIQGCFYVLVMVLFAYRR